MKRILCLCVAILLMAGTATVFAADITGTWTGTVKGPDGNEFPVSFTFKLDGATLTGTVQGPQGDPIAIDKVPQAVVDAVKKELPGAHLTKAYKLFDGNYFLTDVKVGKKEYSVTATPEGKILKREEDND